MQGKKRERFIGMIIAALIAGGIYIGVLVLGKVYPFGSRTIIYHDLEYQYFDYMAWFMNVLHGKADLLFSMEMGGGQGTLSLISYYLMSVFNLLLVFATRETLVLWITVITLLKIMSCAASIHFFLGNRFKLSPFYDIILAVSYSMMGYVVLNSSNIMWLDAVILLPLISLGVYKMVSSNCKAFVLYGLSLALCILSNWYIGFEVCLFVVFYFFFELWLQNGMTMKKMNCRMMVPFGIVSVLAGALTFPFTIPVFFQMRSFGASEGMASLKVGGIQYLLVGFRDLFLNESKLTFGPAVPPIFVGSFAVVVLVAYMLGKNSIYRKMQLLLTAFVWMCFFVVRPLCYIPTMMKVPSNHYHRHAFLFSFFMIVIAALILHEKKVTRQSLLLGTVAGFGLNVFFQYVGPKYRDQKIFLISCAVFAIMGILLILEQTFKKKIVHMGIGVCLLILMCTEFGENWKLELLDHQYDIEKINSYWAQIDEKVQKIKQEDSGIYRIEKTRTRFASGDTIECNSESMSFGFAGISHYSSTCSLYYNIFMKNIGMTGDPKLVVYNPMPLMDDLLGVKYVISDYYIPGNIVTADGYQINEDALPLGMIMEKNADTKYDIGVDPFLNQMNFAKNISSKYEEVYCPMELIEVGSQDGHPTWTFEAREDGPAYACVPGLATGARAMADDKVFLSNIWYNNGIRYIGDYHVGDRIVIGATGLYHENGVGIYTLNTEKLSLATKEIQSRGLAVTEYQGGVLKATFTSQSESEETLRVLFTIPFDNGFTIYVDGQKVSYEKAFDTFITFEIPNKTCSITLKY